MVLGAVGCKGAEVIQKTQSPKERDRVVADLVAGGPELSQEGRGESQVL